ncbi:fk506 binding-like protein : : FKBP_C [Gemmata massiliana]|uniref:Peptidyl-prolyl cis-trans isomerase n=1 Tax=Gemmata massiliana TaxID=1210884 RepID=A0A6P2D7B0_9BACT|nr:FKBP-type peptidyl-prolyl cis-trans isomerase [Gemmata massiliana]VTR97039.1 fk506 binding-like protein : : FKBP_C [Gemmata massiliana]
MSRPIAIVPMFVWLLCGGTPTTVADPPKEKLPPLNVAKDKISFDPKTAEVGTGGSIGGLITVRVKILSRKDDKCVFEYYSDGCGGVSTVYRIEVPTDAGQITVDVATGSKTLAELFPKWRVLYSRNTFSGVRAIVPGTDEYVKFTLGPPVSEMYPQKGDKVKFRYMVFDSAKFDKHLLTGDFTQKMEFEVGSEKVWPWLVLAMDEMTVGDTRRVQVPVKVADGATKWLLKPEESKTLFAEIRLVSIERAKK